MIVRCPQCQAVNPHEHQTGSKEVTCRRCGSILLVWSAQVLADHHVPRPIAVSVKQSQAWDPESETRAAERYVLSLERQLMEYSHEREAIPRPHAPPRQWQIKRMVMVAVLGLAVTLGFVAARFALHMFGPTQVQASQVESVPQ